MSSRQGRVRQSADRQKSVLTTKTNHKVWKTRIKKQICLFVAICQTTPKIFLLRRMISSSLGRFSMQRNIIWQSEQIWANNLRLFLPAQRNSLKINRKQKVPDSQIREPSTFILCSDYARLLLRLLPIGLWREIKWNTISIQGKLHLEILHDRAAHRERDTVKAPSLYSTWWSPTV